MKYMYANTAAEVINQHFYAPVIIYVSDENVVLISDWNLSDDTDLIVERDQNNNLVINEYVEGTITYNSDHGTVPSSKTVIVPYTLTAQDLPTLPDEDDWFFDGWNKSVGDVITQNTTITASWTAAANIVYNTSHGTAPSSKKVRVPYTLTAQDLPTLQDQYWDFNNWDKSVGNQIVGDTTINANWTYKGLNFDIKENCTISMDHPTTYTPDIKYSVDAGATWVQWDCTEISLTNGQNIAFRGNNPNGFYGDSSVSYWARFVMTSGKIYGNGNIMSLIDDGALTTTTIPSSYCFRGLFQNCTSLYKAPDLPATTLKLGCYYSMFSGCTNLTKAPDLPALQVNQEAYGNMFRGCSSLNYIKCMARYIITYGTVYWVRDVATTGTFVKTSASMITDWTTGESGIPTGWTVETAAA